jgi:hypothetical protein
MFVLPWSRRLVHNFMGTVTRAEATGQVLRTRHGQVLGHRHQLGFSMQVFDGGSLVANRDEAHGRILDYLQLLDVRRRSVWVPDRTREVKDRLDKGLERQEEGLFVVAPRGAADSFQKGPS